MGSVPVLKPREVERLLQRHGFSLARQRGSHRQYRHPDGRSTTVPFHAGCDIAPTLLRRIARDIGLSVEELLTRRSRSNGSASRVEVTIGAASDTGWHAVARHVGTALTCNVAIGHETPRGVAEGEPTCQEP